MSENKATKDAKEEKIGVQKEAEITADIAEATSVVVAPKAEEKPHFDSNARGGDQRRTGKFNRHKDREEEKKEFEEKVVAVDRVTRVVKGGRRMRFRALVVIGDKNGRVGYSTGKGNEVTAAVSKAVSKAKKSLVNVVIRDGTILHDVLGKSRTTKVMLKKAKKGTGIIAGGSVRVVLELAGYHNIVAKSYGSNNKINNVIATLDALQSLLKERAPKGSSSRRDHLVEGNKQPTVKK